MNFDKLLEQIQSGQEKVASDNTPQPDADTTVSTALQNVLEKTASAAKDAEPTPQHPADALLKVAQEMADNEKQAEILHSRECGRNFANALIETVAAADAAVKTAQLQEAQHAAVLPPSPEPKLASSDEELYKAAAEIGYTDTVQKLAAEAGYHETMEKVAAVEFEQGQQIALDEIHKAASAEFIRGAQEVDVMIQAAQQQQRAHG